MKKVICILSDALRYDYIDKHNMTFLSKIRNNSKTKYYKEVIPSTGFCEIIEYVTGMKAEDSGYLAQITLKSVFENDYSRKRKLFLHLIQNFESIIYTIPRIRTYYSKFLQPTIDKYLCEFIPEEVVRVRYKIPLVQLENIKPTESLFKYDSFEFGGERNLFHILSQKGLSYDIDDFVLHNKIKGTDDERIKRLLKKINQKKLSDFTLVYIGFCELAHFWGTESEKLKKVLRDYDDKLKKIHEALENNIKNYEFVILGDHGMIDVVNYINIKKLIKMLEKKYKVNQMKDIYYFIDSTMLRIFVKNKNLISDIEKDIEIFLQGKIEIGSKTKAYFEQFKPEYGDIIVLLKPGNVFYPDYFNNSKVKGMHGYLNNTEGQQGLMISIGSEKKKENYVDRIELNEVKNELLHMFNLE